MRQYAKRIFTDKTLVKIFRWVNFVPFALIQFLSDFSFIMWRKAYHLSRLLWLSTGGGWPFLWDHKKTDLSFCIFIGIFLSLSRGLANYSGLEKLQRYGSSFSFRLATPTAGSCLSNVYPTQWLRRWMCPSAGKLACFSPRMLLSWPAYWALSDFYLCRHSVPAHLHHVYV